MKILKTSKRLNIKTINESNYTIVYNHLIKDAYTRSNFVSFPKQFITSSNLNYTSLYYLAETFTEEKLIGYLNGYVKHDTRCFWLQNMIIHPDYYRQYYGTEFFYSIIDILRGTYNVNKIYLTVLDSNQKGKCFWSALGFVKIHSITKEVHTSNITATVYEKNLVR
ncbi:ribosomal protein S18 acetylase RimI-like enzyme [Natranaerovirga hydrolytica]|uniref:Ribosomal protein S18 acetylase RimI-like enzyme n=1 Tax=Natranaerovirga hydrolytica TaxID=680378 RepID=A0A4R1MFY3_9FIRM|nr:GNAT family N-acetyltransferase [Natranaerovirga hydrolytica]TCK89039.1 ribosomal protein S18 acetylase RimI-like enzyme [Natranaerovirga hydrolytica]